MASAVESKKSKEITIQVPSVDLSSYKINDKTTVLELKSQIAKLKSTPVKQLVLERTGEVLGTDSFLLIEDYSLRDGDVIQEKEKEKEFQMKKSRPRMSGALMMVPVNGRCGFDFIQPPVGVHLPDKSTVIAMLKRECEIRASERISRRLNELSMEDLTGIHDMILEIQQQVCDEFGFGAIGPQAIQSARARFPDDPEVVNAAFYLKFNRAKQGPLSVGDEIPDVPLLHLDGTSTSLRAYYRNRQPNALAGTERPLVLVSGSAT